MLLCLKIGTNLVWSISSAQITANLAANTQFYLDILGRIQYPILYIVEIPSLLLDLYYILFI